MSDIRLHGAVGWGCGHELSGGTRAYSHCRGLHASRPHALTLQRLSI